MTTTCRAIFLIPALALINSCESGTSSTAEVPAQKNTHSDFGIPWNKDISFGAIVDPRDGQTYKTVKIGTQTWMAENLNFQTDSSWYYNNNIDTGFKYGRLYLWHSAMNLPIGCDNLFCNTSPEETRQGICPIGWHIPSDSEVNILQSYVGGSSLGGNRLKSSLGWNYMNLLSGNGTDEFGFRALPTGSREIDGGVFGGIGSYGFFWSSSEIDTAHAKTGFLMYNERRFSRNYYSNKHAGFPVRCLKNY